MIEKFMPKGWTTLVDEAITRIVNERIDAVIKEKFPDVKVHNPNSRDMQNMTLPGFDYSIRAYIQSRWAEIIKNDPEVDAVIREGLKRSLLEGFAAMPK